MSKSSSKILLDRGSVCFYGVIAGRYDAVAFRHGNVENRIIKEANALTLHERRQIHGT
jgi:hypothetical protein